MNFIDVAGYLVHASILECFLKGFECPQVGQAALQYALDFRATLPFHLCCKHLAFRNRKVQQDSFVLLLMIGLVTKATISSQSKRYSTLQASVLLIPFRRFCA
jgi:hypothetical protein